MTTVNSVETPSGKRANDAEHVLTVFEQPAQKVGSDEAASPKHRDWPAQSAYPVAGFQHGQLASEFAASAIPSASRWLRRLRKACEP